MLFQMVPQGLETQRYIFVAFQSDPLHLAIGKHKSIGGLDVTLGCPVFPNDGQLVLEVFLDRCLGLRLFAVFAYSDGLGDGLVFVFGVVFHREDTQCIGILVDQW